MSASGVGLAAGVGGISGTKPTPNIRTKAKMIIPKIEIGFKI